MTQPAPIKQPHTEGKLGLFSRPWIRWFQTTFEDLDLLTTTIVTNPTSPYTVVNNNVLIFIDTATTFTVNLKAKADKLKARIVNVKNSTANVLVYPNGSDLLYGVNDFETIYPDEARDLDCSSVEGWY